MVWLRPRDISLYTGTKKMICNYAGFCENATKQNPDLKIYKIIFLKIFYEPKTLILMIKYPTFDRSIRLHIQFFDEKFLPEQFVFILPILLITYPEHHMRLMNTSIYRSFV